MKREEFVLQFAELLDVEPLVLTAETEMGSLENWDSVAYLSAMVMIDDRLGIAVGPGVLSNAATFGAILDAVKDKLE
jgi:acyl carrier protein